MCFYDNKRKDYYLGTVVSFIASNDNPASEVDLYGIIDDEDCDGEIDSRDLSLTQLKTALCNYKNKSITSKITKKNT